MLDLMTGNDDKAKRRADTEARKEEAFKLFKTDPLAAALIGTIPLSVNLDIVLRAAFFAGYGCGGGDTAMQLVEAIMTKDKPPKRESADEAQSAG